MSHWKLSQHLSYSRPPTHLQHTPANNYLGSTPFLAAIIFTNLRGKLYSVQISAPKSKHPKSCTASSRSGAQPPPSIPKLPIHHHLCTSSSPVLIDIDMELHMGLLGAEPRSSGSLEIAPSQLQGVERNNFKSSVGFHRIPWDSMGSFGIFKILCSSLGIGTDSPKAPY